MLSLKLEISLLLLLTSGPVSPKPGFLEDIDLLQEAGNLSRDLNSIYTGWGNSSFIYPYYLKVSDRLNALTYIRFKVNSLSIYCMMYTYILMPVLQ